MALIITTCTNRKRKTVPDALHASALVRANLDALVSDWSGRIAAASERCEAGDLYGGRGFQDAAAVAHRVAGPLMIVSAGLGLISSTTLVPAYACTVIAGTDDNIVGRLTDGSSAADWWRSISKSLPQSSSIAEAFATSKGLVLAALSDAYIDLIADEIEALPISSRHRLRLFTRAPKRRIASALRPFIMPYDDRLDGPDSPIRGTRGDFAPRAMRHFAESILIDSDDRDTAHHIAAVEAAIDTWAFPDRPDRARHDDRTLRAMIAEHWDALGGSTSRLLPFFRRDLNIACEQGRFAALVRDVRSTRS